MYQIFNPPSHLKKIIRHFWLLNVDSDQKTLKEYMFSYPYVNWVFTLGTPYTVTDKEKGAITVKDTRILGPRTNFAEYIHPKGNMTFGITFRFGGSYPIFKEETRHLANRALSQEELFPDAAWLTSYFYENTVEMFIKEIIKHISVFDLDYDQKGRSIWNLFVEIIVKEKHYTTSAGLLSKKLGISQRHLQRITKRYSGMTPKQVQSMIRCRMAIRHIQRTGFILDFFHYGYYDQNHFIRDVKKWSGHTPKKLIAIIAHAN